MTHPVEIKCDHLGCPIPPSRAPRVVVFSKTPFEPDHRPLKMMTTLHYCEMHRGELKIEDLLTPQIKLDFEKTARIARPIGFKPNFEFAHIEWVLVTTPEYRAFLLKLGAGNIIQLART